MCLGANAFISLMPSFLISNPTSSSTASKVIASVPGTGRGSACDSPLSAGRAQPRPCLEQTQRTASPWSYSAGVKDSLTSIPGTGPLLGPEPSLPRSHGTAIPQVPSLPSPGWHSVLLWSFQEQNWTRPCFRNPNLHGGCRMGSSLEPTGGWRQAGNHC